jgi:hypothetical protein
VRTGGYSSAIALLTTRKALLQCQATQLNEAMPLIMRDVPERQTEHAPRAAQAIISYI